MTAANAAAESAIDTVECPFCAEQINARAKKCRHCGEILDVTLRHAGEAMRAQGGVTINNHVNGPAYQRAVKSKVVAILLALFLGGIGGHKFYLDRPGQGILYLIFCWTFIPGIIAFIEAIIYLCSSEQSFHQKYG